MQKSKMFLTTVFIAIIAVVVLAVACNQNNSKEETIQTTQSIGLNNQGQNDSNQSLSTNADNTANQTQQDNTNQDNAAYRKSETNSQTNNTQRKPDYTKRDIDKEKLETALKNTSGMSNFKEIAKGNNRNTTASNDIESNIHPAGNPKDYGPIQKIVFGSYGGFSGSKTEHTLHPSGLVQKTNSLTKEVVEFKVYDQDKISEIFEMFDGLDITRYDFNSPGNMTYYVGAVYADAKHNVYWGSPNFRAPSQFNEFQKAAKQFIRENNPNK